jgi:hypothetical protein
MQSFLKVFAPSNLANGLVSWIATRGQVLVAATAGRDAGALTDAATIAIDANIGSVFSFNATNNNVREFQVPTGGAFDQAVTLMFTNSSGGVLTGTSFHTNILQSLGIDWPATGNTQLFRLRKVTATLWALETNMAQLRGVLLANRVYDGGSLGMGAPNDTLAFGEQKLQNGATVGGTNSFVTVAAQAAFNTGAIGTVGAARWAAISLQASAAAAVTVQSAPLNYAAGYASEAAALAAMAALASSAGTVRFAVVAVLASGAGFVFDTDAFAGGAGGNPATTTNYYRPGYDFAGLLAD